MIESLFCSLQLCGSSCMGKNFCRSCNLVAQNHVIAEHIRSYDRNQMITVLDHYLEVLLKKPRAIRDAHAFQSNEIPDVFRRFHLKMREQEGSVGDRKFIRLLLLHRDIGMDNLTKALLEAEKTQVFRYEKVHEIIQRLTNQHIPISTLPMDKTPVNLLDYKVNKSNIEQYGQLTGGTRK